MPDLLGTLSRLTWDAEGGAEVINHGGDQGATRVATGDKGGKGDSKGRAEAKATTRDPRSRLLLGVIREVTTEGGARRGMQLPDKGGEQVMVKRSPFDARVVHVLGYVSTLLPWGRGRQHRSLSAFRHRAAPTPRPAR